MEVFPASELSETTALGALSEKWPSSCSRRALRFLVSGVNPLGSVHFLYFGRFGKCSGVFSKFLFVGF